MLLNILTPRSGVLSEMIVLVLPQRVKKFPLYSIYSIYSSSPFVAIAHQVKPLHKIKS
jgi:hypothetical protein